MGLSEAAAAVSVLRGRRGGLLIWLPCNSRTLLVDGHEVLPFALIQNDIEFVFEVIGS